MKNFNFLLTMAFLLAFGVTILLPVQEVFAQTNPIGVIIAPTGGLLATPAIDASGKLTGVIALLNSILRLIFITAGLWGFINLLISGFQFMTAGGDPKAISKAWEKIWQSFLGLLIIVTSFLLAAIIGILLFRDPVAILQPSL
ncbi:hypothetical protein HYW55_05865 [Candidatus Gottesmanbacteria bacterium]|nr:hypothetical protein [Candidatus Gottesmanbacteria bacterium]